MAPKPRRSRPPQEEKDAFAGKGKKAHKVKNKKMGGGGNQPGFDPADCRRARERGRRRDAAARKVKTFTRHKTRIVGTRRRGSRRGEEGGRQCQTAREIERAEATATRLGKMASARACQQCNGACIPRSC